MFVSCRKDATIILGNLHCSCAVMDVRIQYVENYFSYSFDLSVHGEVLVDIRL